MPDRDSALACRRGEIPACAYERQRRRILLKGTATSFEDLNPEQKEAADEIQNLDDEQLDGVIGGVTAYDGPREQDRKSKKDDPSKE